MNNNELIQLDFGEYFIDNVKDINIPPYEPYNGLENNGKYMEVTINMEKWNQKYKKYPSKKSIKGLTIKFSFDDMNIIADIKDYKLCQYGYQCLFILTNFILDDPYNKMNFCEK